MRHLRHCGPTHNFGHQHTLSLNAAKNQHYQQSTSSTLRLRKFLDWDWLKTGGQEAFISSVNSQEFTSGRGTSSLASTESPQLAPLRGSYGGWLLTKSFESASRPQLLQIADTSRPERWQHCQDTFADPSILRAMLRRFPFTVEGILARQLVLRTSRLSLLPRYLRHDDNMRMKLKTPLQLYLWLIIWW